LLLFVAYFPPSSLYVIRYFISDAIGPTDLLHPSAAPHFKTSQVFLICVPKCPGFSTRKSYATNVALYQFLP
jgi:hypothetical protein